MNECRIGDCRNIMRELIAEGVRVQCVVTSPPYWGLRDYGIEGQIDLELSLSQYVERICEVFSLVNELLADDGVLWLNLGDSYSNKSLNGVPWRVAFALQDQGWYLRQDIIWHKPNPMPESVRDRCTKAHEYLFMLTKSERYYYDADAIKEPAIYFDDDRKGRAKDDHKSAPDAKRNGVRPSKIPSGWDTGTGSHNDLRGRYQAQPVFKDARSYDGKHSDKQRGHSRRHAGFNDRWDEMSREKQCSAMRNKRSVWTIPLQSDRTRQSALELVA